MTKLIDIQEQIQKLQKQAEEIKSKEYQATIADILSKMQAFGITVKDLQPGKRRGPKPKGAAPAKKVKAPKVKSGTPVAAKYKGPNGETWSGRGLMPKWLSALVASGQDKDSFSIAKADQTAD